MRFPLPLPDGLNHLQVEVYYPDDQTRFSKTEVVAGIRELKVKLPAPPDECLIRVFPVQNSEPLSVGYVYLDGQLRPYRPEIHTLSTAGASITDELVESVEESDEPPVEIVEEDRDSTLDMGEPMDLDVAADVDLVPEELSVLQVVTESGMQPLKDALSAELEDESDE